jgi:sarcinarray family protein
MRIILAFILSFIVFVIPLSHAGECEYGTVKAWARTLDKDGKWGEWRNATVHETLKVHEPFQVMVKVTSKVDCIHLYVSLERPGSTKAYEVLEGPSKIMDYIRNHNVSAGWSKTYEWTLRPTGKWTDGMAALNVGSYFYTGEMKIVDFTIIAAYICPEKWNGSMPDEKNSIPEFGSTVSIISFTFAIFFIFIFGRGHNG